MIKILGLYGKKGSGKDTIFKYLTKKGINVKRFAFGDALKDECASKYGLSRKLLYGSYKDKQSPVPYVWFAKDKKIFHVDAIPQEYSNQEYENLTIRTFIQYYGTEICRSINFDCWLNACFYEIDIFTEEYPYFIIVITDSRFQNENDAITKRGGIVCGLTREISKDTHASEPDVKEENVDFIIHNQNMSRQEQAEIVFKELKERNWL